MIVSLALFYGYYIISCESCGMTEEVLEPIIGQRCYTRSLSFIEESGVRPCRHRTAGLQRCHSADSQGDEHEKKLLLRLPFILLQLS